MPTFAFLTGPLHITMQLQPRQNAPLPLVPKHKSMSSVDSLMPDHYRCPVARPVSCYALFE